MRCARVAGVFYPSSAAQIRTALAEFEARRSKPPRLGEVVGVVVPHAGWIYSGLCASFAYAVLRESFGDGTCFIFLAPNHTGAGASVAISRRDWVTPLGVAKHDEEVARMVARNSQLAQFDDGAHANEHSIEVQLPFVQSAWRSFTFVAIALMRQDVVMARDLGFAIAKAAKEVQRRVCVIASSDFTHYEPRSLAREKDLWAFEAIAVLDESAFLERVAARRISICGAGAIAAAISYAKLAGAKRCKLLHIDDSGAVTGETSVVNYIAAAFTQ